MGFFEKISIKKAITHNFWLKLLALIVAIAVWFYVYISMTTGGKIT